MGDRYLIHQWVKKTDIKLISVVIVLSALKGKDQGKEKAKLAK